MKLLREEVSCTVLTVEGSIVKIKSKMFSPLILTPYRTLAFLNRTWTPNRTGSTAWLPFSSIRGATHLNRSVSASQESRPQGETHRELWPEAWTYHQDNWSGPRQSEQLHVLRTNTQNRSSCSPGPRQWRWSIARERERDLHSRRPLRADRCRRPSWKTADFTLSEGEFTKTQINCFQVRTDVRLQIVCLWL